MARKETLYEEKKRNTKQYRLELRKTLDADLIEKLDTVENKAGYLKSLIKSDIKNGGGVEFENPDTLSPREKRIVLRYITRLIEEDIKGEKEE